MSFHFYVLSLSSSGVKAALQPLDEIRLTCGSTWRLRHTIYGGSAKWNELLGSGTTFLARHLRREP